MPIWNHFSRIVIEINRSDRDAYRQAIAPKTMRDDLYEYILSAISKMKTQPKVKHEKSA